MKKADKITLVKEEVIFDLEDGKSVEYIAEQIYTKYSDKLNITEVGGLVRSIGKEAGLILTAAEKRENALKFMDLEGWDFTEEIDIEVLGRRISILVKDFGVTESWVKSTLKEKYGEHGIELPSTPRTRKLGGWRLMLAETLRDNPDFDDESLIDFVEPTVSSRKVAADYVRDFAPMIRVALGIEG